jgi:hypothetical protein
LHRTPGGSTCNACFCDHPVPVRPVHVLETPEPGAAHPFGCSVHLLGPVQRLRPVVCPTSAAPRSLGGRTVREPSDAALCGMGDSATSCLRALGTTGQRLSPDPLHVRRRLADRCVERTRIPARRVYDRRRGKTRPVSAQSLVMFDEICTVCNGKRSIDTHHAVLDGGVQPISFRLGESRGTTHMPGATATQNMCTSTSNRPHGCIRCVCPIHYIVMLSYCDFYMDNRRDDAWSCYLIVAFTWRHIALLSS